MAQVLLLGLTSIICMLLHNINIYLASDRMQTKRIKYFNLIPSQKTAVKLRTKHEENYKLLIIA